MIVSLYISSLAMLFYSIKVPVFLLNSSIKFYLLLISLCIILYYDSIKLLLSSSLSIYAVYYFSWVLICSFCCFQCVTSSLFFFKDASLPYNISSSSTILKLSSFTYSSNLVLVIFSDCNLSLNLLTSVMRVSYADLS